ncbi:MAG TPA: Rrf2 family transcriptional regulator [Gemmatimonadaceae bacterium]
MNSRFAVAVHILTLLEQQQGEPVTSEYIAGSVNTNPSLVRRLIGMLAKAGIADSQLGTGGGALLARPAAKITLLDVYRAVGEGELFALHRERPNPACPIGRNIQAALESHFDAASRALEEQLRRVTIADMLADVRKQDRRRGSHVA